MPRPPPRCTPGRGRLVDALDRLRRPVAAVRPGAAGRRCWTGRASSWRRRSGRPRRAGVHLRRHRGGQPGRDRARQGGQASPPPGRLGGRAHLGAGPGQALTGQGFEVAEVEVDRTGRVDPAELAAAVRDDTLLVCLQHAFYEVGTIQPVEAARWPTSTGRCCWSTPGPVGRLPVDVADLGADLLVASGHGVMATRHRLSGHPPGGPGCGQVVGDGASAAAAPAWRTCPASPPWPPPCLPGGRGPRRARPHGRPGRACWTGWPPSPRWSSTATPPGASPPGGLLDPLHRGGGAAAAAGRQGHRRPLRVLVHRRHPGALPRPGRHGRHHPRLGTGVVPARRHRRRRRPPPGGAARRRRRPPRDGRAGRPGHRTESR